MSNKRLGIMIVAGWLALLLAKPIADTFDNLTTAQPWFNVELELEGDQMIYTREINRWLRGDWTASVQIPAGEGRWMSICSGSGRSIYRPDASGTVHRDFETFTGGCIEPAGRYRLCADYMMRDQRGLIRPFGPFCAEGKGMGDTGPKGLRLPL